MNAATPYFDHIDIPVELQRGFDLQRAAYLENPEPTRAQRMADLVSLVRLLKGRYAVLNMIPYNTVPGLPFRRPARDKAVALARELHSKGVLTKLRNSAGQDVDAGCGQLRARAQPVRVHRAAA